MGQRSSGLLIKLQERVTGQILEGRCLQRTGSRKRLPSKAPLSGPSPLFWRQLIILVLDFSASPTCAHFWPLLTYAYTIVIYTWND